MLASLLLLIVVARAGAAEVGPPELDVALLAARAAHRALIVEFSTTWCGPCRVLAEKVLPDPAVKAALAEVSFVQYDAERGAGQKAAARLAVAGYPTLVVVGDGGVALDRIVGLREPADLAAWLQRARDQARPGIDVLLGEAKQRPRDAGLLLTIGRRQLEAGDRVSARRSFAVSEKVAARGSRDADEAAFEGMRIDVVDGEHALRARLARGYLERFPSGVHALEAAEIYSLSSPAKEEAERLLGAVVGAVLASGDRDGQRRLGLACLRTGAMAAALSAAAPPVEKERTAAGLALLAEVRHQRGENGIAQSLSDEARRLSSGRERIKIEANLARYRRGGTDPGDTLYLSDPLDPKLPAAAAPPLDPEAETKAARVTAFRQLVGRASRACAPYARGTFRRVWVRVQLRDHRVERVLMLEPRVPMLLEACIAGELTGAIFVHPTESEDTFPILF